MPDPNVTHAFAATFVDELARAGLDTVCLAPGSRSTPLAVAFARHPAVRHLVHLDERSASFFALGRARVTGRAVALLCTSGTAAAEFHAAVLEADLSRVPLLVLTADRPPELRGVGANQVIDQVGLYGSAVRWFVDPGPPEELGDGGRAWRRLAGRALAATAGPPPGPVQANLPFREPLLPPPGVRVDPLPAPAPTLVVTPSLGLPQEADLDRLAARLEAAERPLIVAGELTATELAVAGGPLGAGVDALARAVGAPALAEPSSGLRRAGGVHLVPPGDALLRAGFGARHRPDVVVRLGALPTSKALGALLAGSGAFQIVLDPGGGWRDPDLVAGEFWRTDLVATLEGLAERCRQPCDRSWTRAWITAGERATRTLDSALDASPLHEGHVVRALARALTEPGAPRLPVFVGSSLPIRDVDTFWPATAGIRLYGNRGASGIDGLVSSGLGVADAAGGRAVLLIGDLSLYHDMNGLWAIRRHGLRPLVLVLDNNGGGIFDTLPQAGHEDVFEELFGTPLDLRVEDVATLYGLDVEVAETPSGVERAIRNSLAGDRPAMVVARFSR
ncbi:MAG: 2-succinyl-5-enolpyruvyl-6-hydroxy-3-cyclohexene-1-carboxylic-acid synthase, partial [Candidatus Dormibacteraceae bacterium]